jgi:transposase
LKFGEGHRARIVEDMVNQLGPKKLRAIYRGVGSPAHPPELVLKMVLFEYLQGRSSPAQWHRDASEHDAMKWLGRGVQPSRSAWYGFRDRMEKIIHELNDDLICSAVAEGLICPQEAAQDGTTFRSNGSRHRGMNQKTLEKRMAIVQAAIQSDVDNQPLQAEAPKWMPPTVDGRSGLYQRMLTAEEVLRQRLAENAKKPKKSRREEKNIVVSLTDPEAPFARDKEKTFCFLYTTQFMVGASSLMVLGYSVAAENTDVGTLAPMIDQVQELIGGTLQQVSADAGYTSVLDLQDCSDRKISLIAPVQQNSFTEAKQIQKSRSKSPKRSPQIHRDEFRWLEDEQTYECPQGHRLSYKHQERVAKHRGRYVMTRNYRCSPEHCMKCPIASRCTTIPHKGRSVRRMKGQELIDAQREKMKQDNVKEIYRKRGQTIERAFGDAKSHRSFGRFHGRGLSRAKAEVGLLVMAQNTLILHRLRAEAKTTKKHAA